VILPGGFFLGDGDLKNCNHFVRPMKGLPIQVKAIVAISFS
jgi:hypothetical protein